MFYDPFDLRRMFHKTRDGCQNVVIIPPEAKLNIKKQLQNLGITEEFVYPEMDSVSYALNNQIKE